MARWETTTPLGFPVEPDVKIMYAGSSGPAAGPSGGPPAASGRTTWTPSAVSGPAQRASVTTSPMPASASRAVTRGAGCSGSSGT